MATFKEFQGKTLDEAIQEACNYYGVGREKLEVEILNDAKTGIFGLVSVKKAKIKAAKVQLSSLIDGAESDKENQRQDLPDSSKKTFTSKEENTDVAPLPTAKKKSGSSSADKKKRKSSTIKPLILNDSEDDSVDSIIQEKRKIQPKKSNESDDSDEGEEALPDFLAELILEDLDQEKVINLATETLRTLITPIAGNAPIEVSIDKNRIRAHVDCGEDSGLLVGREGVTLTALQYIAGRVMAKELGGAVRLHIDAGDYRERQDSRLAELALSLAEKVKETGKSQATRLLSAYQRRLVHLALEEDDTIQTLSKGEGAKRRVIIQLRKGSNKKALRTKSEQDVLLLANETNEIALDSDSFPSSDQE